MQRVIFNFSKKERVIFQVKKKEIKEETNNNTQCMTRIFNLQDKINCLQLCILATKKKRKT